MKRILKAFAVIICMMLCTYAYTQTLTVKFTGRDQTGQHYVKLDHVKTFNLDQLWEEVLYFPDTTLVLGGVGIIDYGNPSNSQLEQNVPNPFNGTTHFTLYLREGADALLEVFDLMGKTITSQYYANLSAGAHLFSANLTNPQVYILKVTVKNEQMHLKMVNEGFGTENSINYESVATQSNDFDSEAKNGQAMGIYPFHNGDELQHTGYTVINGVEYKSETITQQQNESETLILPFNLTPTVNTNTVSSITSSSAVCGGGVSYTGEATIVNRGVCWSTSPNPTINDNSTFDGNGIGSFTSNIIGLTPGTTYYVKAYATSSASITGYGEQVTFNTLATIPSVTTSVVSNITDNSATCGGNVTSDGGATVTARGICWSTNQNPTIGDNHTTDGSGTGVFTSSITGLVPNTTYYVRAYATNSEVTSYGEQRTFITIITPPTVLTLNVSNISTTSATCGGNVLSDGGATVTSRGICWNTVQNPTINDNFTNDGNGVGVFISTLINLSPGITYYVRAYATNSEGTSYGVQETFTTQVGLPCPNATTLTDVDGNIYNTIQLGNQCWMKENLRTTHYSDGTSIALGTTDTSNTIPYRYYPYNGADNVSIYGYLYNWAAVMHNSTSSDIIPSGVQGICPIGWHVPSEAEWNLLITFVGSQSQFVCGNESTYIAKALASTTEWANSIITCAVGNNPSTNNTTDFKALPTGEHQLNDYIYGHEQKGSFWSSTSNSNDGARIISFRYSEATPYSANYYKYWGISVRCLRDETAIDGQPCPSSEIISDYDGNNYPTVHLGAQCWMAQNLRTTHYANGTSIALGSDTSSIIPYRYYPDNNLENVNVYGYLYNWKAIMGSSSSSYSNPSGVQGICPDGWHVPSSNEWYQLMYYVGNQSHYRCNINGYPGEIAKALASITGWNSSTSTCAIGNNSSSNNATGFTAMPAGTRNGNGNYNNYGRFACFWTSSQNINDYKVSYRRLTHDSGSLTQWYGDINEGYSVRCVKD